MKRRHFRVLTFTPPQRHAATAHGLPPVIVKLQRLAIEQPFAARVVENLIDGFLDPRRYPWERRP